MKNLLAILFISTIFFATSANSSAGTDPVGFIKTVSGEVLLINDQGRHTATENMPINQGDFLKTGTTGSVGLIFADDTVVSLGPNSEFSLENFQFNPIDRKLSFVSRLVKGTFALVTGQIAKLAPNKVIFSTPEATLGVRGTKFLVKID